MKTGDGGFRPAYDVQLSTDVDSRVIVGVAVTNVGTDMQQMTPMPAERRTGAHPAEHLVDGGFTKLEAIEAAAGTCVHAPVPTPRGRHRCTSAEPQRSDVIGKWRQRMGTEKAKETYKQRALTAETGNAELRCDRGLNRLRVRGAGKVR